MTKPANIPAIERATDRSWPAWLTFFAGIEAERLTHAEIVARVVDEISDRVERSHGWWAQGITIAYEQHLGRRVPGQGTDGEFRAGATKTFPGELDEARAAWLAVVDGRSAFDGVERDGEATESTTPKRQYWRCGLTDGSRVTVAFEPGSPGKSRIAVEHTKLDSAEAIDGWKTFWKGLLAQTTA